MLPVPAAIPNLLIHNLIWANSQAGRDLAHLLGIMNRASTTLTRRKAVWGPKRTLTRSVARLLVPRPWLPPRAATASRASTHQAGEAELLRT